MIGFMKDLSNLLDFINFNEVLTFIFLAFMSVLITVSIIKLIYSVKEFTEKAVIIVVEDLKSHKNHRRKK